MIDLSQITLAVLAGGEGRRMGMPKSLLRINGLPILEVLLNQLQWPGPLLLVTAPGREHPPQCELFQREVVDEVVEGPLRGLLTALENCSTDRLGVVTVDMLGVRACHVQFLLEQSNVAGSMFQRSAAGTTEIEPFPFVCRKSAVSDVSSHLANGSRSMRSLLNRPGFTAINAPTDWPENVWMNLNTPADLLRYHGSR